LRRIADSRERSENGPAAFAQVLILATIFGTSQEDGMAYDKRYVAQKRQRRRRKLARMKLKLYEQGKITHAKLPALSKRFLRRKMRALKRAE
jgi:hypothetical protein